ncbi:hypothetical protein Tco_0773961 [Tanacetum coccineum]|uniref:Uncharacterized protein n=1 Tax=Tanacetum coccineum TaxID=301880 RepID=A0ABQ4ZN35_9ASTR
MADQQNIRKQQQLENQEQQHQDRPNEELVLVDDQVRIGASNYRIALEKSQPDQFWHTVTYDLTTKTYFYILDDQIFEVNVELLREVLQITPKDYDHPFVEPPSKKAIHSFINKLEEEEPQLTRRRQNGVTIRRETHGESDEKNLDHSSKLKGNETLSATAQFKLDMKKARKASKDDFFIQQHPKGLGEGSGVTLEVPDGLSRKGPNEGSSVTQAVIDGPSGSSRSSSSKSEIEDIFSDDESDGADDEEKADDSKTAGDEKAIEEQVDKEHTKEEQNIDDQGGNEQAGDIQAKVHVTKPHIEKPEVTILSFSQTLSSGEYGNQFIMIILMYH